MSLMDRYDKFLNTYIRRSTITKETEVKSDDIFDSEDYTEESNKFSLDNITPQLRREMALTAPFFWKGLTKKSRDTFKAWANWYRLDDDKEMSATEQMIIDIFDRRTNIKKKLVIVSISTIVYGDGYLLMEFNTDNPKIKDYISNAVRKKSEPRQLRVLDAEKINERRYKNNYWKRKGIQHYVYNDQNKGVEKLIHPDRLLHFKEDELPFSSFGISKVDILRHIISSIADVDIATGEILKWFAHGLITVSKEGLQTNEKKDVEKELAKHHSFFVNDKQYEMDVKVPTAIKPKEFYDHLIQSIAAVLVMPTHLLQGIQVGKVEGAETSYADYYNDVKDNQFFTYEPNLIKLYSLLFNSMDRRFDYYPVWNDIYINENAEADLMGKRAGTVVNLKGAGVVDNEEGREILNRGFYRLDPKKKIEQPKVNLSPVDKRPGKPSLDNKPIEKAKNVKKKTDTEKVADARKAIRLRKERDLFEMSKDERETALQEKRTEKKDE